MSYYECHFNRQFPDVPPYIRNIPLIVHYFNNPNHIKYEAAVIYYRWAEDSTPEKRKDFFFKVLKAVKETTKMQVWYNFYENECVLVQKSKKDAIGIYRAFHNATEAIFFVWKDWFLRGAKDCYVLDSAGNGEDVYYARISPVEDAGRIRGMGYIRACMHDAGLVKDLRKDKWLKKDADVIEAFWAKYPVFKGDARQYYLQKNIFEILEGSVAESFVKEYDDWRDGKIKGKKVPSHVAKGLKTGLLQYNHEKKDKKKRRHGH